jgi:TolB protein
MNADGSDLRNLTKAPDDVARGASQGPPVWSPDGTMLAFEGDDGKTDGLYLMNADGTGFRLLADGGPPVWSPDGSRILFTMRSDLYTIAPDGTVTTQLTNAPGWDDQPSWSTDGSRIAFVRGDGGVNSVLVMAADGSDPHQVFQQKGVYPHQPLWSPDGRQLLLEAETATVHGNYDLYLVDADGSR